MADKRLGVKSRTARPSLVGRKARCIKCGRVVKSDWSLDFFVYHGNEKFDEYYCGCESKKSEWYNDAKAGGTSLALGSDEYEEFVEQLRSYNIDRCIELQQAALDRYNAR